MRKSEKYGNTPGTFWRTCGKNKSQSERTSFRNAHTQKVSLRCESFCVPVKSNVVLLNSNHNNMKPTNVYIILKHASYC